MGSSPINTSFNNIEQTKAVLKIGFVDARPASQGLVFECLVYDRVVTPILDAQITPCFLRSFLVTQNCTYNDLLVTLENGLPAAQTRDQKQQSLNRNLRYMKLKLEKRPAIDQVTLNPDPADVYPAYVNDRFLATATEFPDVKKYADWVNGRDEYTRMTVLLQILIALRVMAYARLMHNDLHGLNIMIKKCAKDSKVTYVIDGLGPITLTVSYIPLIFDFDHSSCEQLGVNGLLGKPIAFEINKDLSNMYAYFVAFQANSPKLAQATADMTRIFSVRQPNLTQTFSGATRANWDSFPGRIQSSIIDGIREIVSIISGLQENKQRPPQAPHFDKGASIYYVTPKMFLGDGRLNRGGFLSDSTRLERCIADADRQRQALEKAEENIRELQKEVQSLQAHSKRRKMRPADELGAFAF